MLHVLKCGGTEVWLQPCDVSAQSYLTGASDTNTILVVVVALSFATSADCHGRAAPARNGTNIDFLNMQTWL